MTLTQVKIAIAGKVKRLWLKDNRSFMKAILKATYQTDEQAKIQEIRKGLPQSKYILP